MVQGRNFGKIDGYRYRFERSAWSAYAEQDKEKAVLNKRLMVLLVLVALAALSRLVPHPPNVAPIAALALFGGAYFPDRRLAFLVPGLALLVSDLVIGFHSQLVLVYASFAMTVGIGFLLRGRVRILSVAAAAVGSSALFFAVTNFGVWLLDGLYPTTLEGLVTAYVAAIPFFQNSLMGNLFYTAVLFGGFAAAERWASGVKLPVARTA